MHARDISKLLLRRIDRMIDLAPHFFRHPAHLQQVFKGIHPAALSTLDKPWLREFDFDTILDVGANTGQFARAVNYVFPNARIYSFEPLPQCLAQLNTKMAGIESFQSFETAVGDYDGTIIIRQSPSSPSSSILPMTNDHAQAFPWTKDGTDLEVEIHRLDWFLPQLYLEGKNLLKIDVQGYSVPVLEGASSILAKSEMVLVEVSFMSLYEGEATFDQVYDLLTSAGFTFLGLLDQLEHPKSHLILQGDAIFRRGI